MENLKKRNEPEEKVVEDEVEGKTDEPKKESPLKGNSYRGRVRNLWLKKQ